MFGVYPGPAGGELLLEVVSPAREGGEHLGIVGDSPPNPVRVLGSSDEGSDRLRVAITPAATVSAARRLPSTLVRRPATTDEPSKASATTTQTLVVLSSAGTAVAGAASPPALFSWAPSSWMPQDADGDRILLAHEGAADGVRARDGVIVRGVLDGPVAFAAVILLVEEVPYTRVTYLLESITPLPAQNNRGSFGYHRHRGRPGVQTVRPAGTGSGGATAAPARVGTSRSRSSGRTPTRPPSASVSGPGKLRQWREGQVQDQAAVPGLRGYGRRSHRSPAPEDPTHTRRVRQDVVQR